MPAEITRETIPTSSIEKRPTAENWDLRFRRAIGKPSSHTNPQVAVVREKDLAREADVEAAVATLTAKFPALPGVRVREEGLTLQLALMGTWVQVNNIVPLEVGAETTESE